MDDDAYGKPKSDSFKKRYRNQLDNGKRKRINPYPSHDHTSGTPKVIETVYRILCPVKKIGSVLGKGGEIVNALRGETHAKIRVADAIPGAEERVIIIFNYPSNQSGKNDGDQDHEIDEFAENESDDMRPHCPAQNALMKVHDRIAADEYVRGGVVHEKSDPEDGATARILVPSNQVGCLLGKGGTVIKKLRSDYTGANIRILPSEHLPPCAMSTDELVQVVHFHFPLFVHIVHYFILCGLSCYITVCGISKLRTLFYLLAVYIWSRYRKSYPFLDLLDSCNFVRF